MKTNGATWKAYLASWPDGQYFDDSDETFNGHQVDGDPADDDVVQFTTGVVFAGEHDREGKDLVRHFSRWKKAQTVEAVLCWVPRERVDELKTLVRSIGGSTKS